MAITFVMAGVTGAFGMFLLPGFVAIVWPAAPSLAALGAMAIGQVARRVADGYLTTPQLVALALLLGLGAGAVWLSFRVPRSAEPRAPWRLLLPLVAGAALVLPALAAGGDLDVRGGEPLAGTLGLYVLGIGAGLVRIDRTVLRWSGVLTLATGLSLLLLSLGTERLRGNEPGIAWSRGRAVAGASVSLETYHSSLVSVSPSARYFAMRELQVGADGVAGSTWSYSVADFAGFTRDVHGQAVAFPSDEHLLVLEARGSGFELRLEPIAGGAPVWTRPIPALFRPEVTVDGTGRWSVVGVHEPSDRAILVTATGSGPARVLSARVDGPYAQRIPMEGGLLFFRSGPLARGLAGILWVLGVRAPAWREVRLAEAAGERRLGTIRGAPDCSGADGARVVCKVTPNRRAMLWSISSDGAMERVGAVPPNLRQFVLRGGVLGAVRWNHDEFVLIDPRARRGTRFRLPGLVPAGAAHPVAGGVVVQHSDGLTDRVTVFRPRP